MPANQLTARPPRSQLRVAVASRTNPRDRNVALGRHEKLQLICPGVTNIAICGGGKHLVTTSSVSPEMIDLDHAGITPMERRSAENPGPVYMR